MKPQLKGHLKGALNGRATVDEVKAVRQTIISICEGAGMRIFDSDTPAGRGWRMRLQTYE